MSAESNMTMPAVKRSRKSLGGLPSRRTLEKENATVDLASTSLAANRKKSRSKSIGPGGLDALKPSNGNRRVSLAAPVGPPPRSILKPTIPVLPEIPPHRPRTSAGRDSDSTKVALRTEEEQQAAAREREERERAELEKDIHNRREARRKSLANRRVSFAAEATLHTFHEIEYMQDSTTSTDSTRRASQTAASPAPPAAVHNPESDDASEPPSTPPDHVDHGVAELPEDQRGLHQKRRRRSLGVKPLDAHDDTLNTTVYDSGSEDGDAIEEQDDVSEASDSDGTMMTLDADEVTSGSGITAGSMSMMSNDSTTSIDEMLRLATERAGVGAAAREPDENEELIPAFVGWGKRPAATSSYAPQSPEIESSPVKSVHEESDHDNGGEMEMTRPMGGIIRSTHDDDQSTVAPDDEDGEDEEDDAMSMDMDMSMEMTHALGGIVGKKASAVPKGRPEATICVDQTMDFTMPMGGIQSSAPKENKDDEEPDYDSNEDMSMEMTTVMGGVLSTTRAGGGQQSGRRTLMRTEDGDGETMGMDMTVGLGRILPLAKQQNDAADQSLGDATVGMEMTTALGGIIADSSPLVCLQTPNKTGATSPLRKMTLSHKPVSPTRTRTPTKKAAPLRGRIARTPERSAFNGSGLRRTPERQTSPPKQLPQPQPQTPSKSVASSPPKFIGSKSRSPVRFSSPKVRATPQSSPRPRSTGPGVFQQNRVTGSTTPLIVLTPQTRRLSGIGADRSGLGSPKIAQILERRGSIGDAARDFVPGDGLELRRGVKWDDPRILEQELDRQREQELAREDGRRIMEREADGALDDRDATLSLKEMIQGLSPKKNPLKGRKSLHVGSAKGLLGKRPTELDDEEAEEQDGVKRLKNLQGSPVKSIRLQHPPSKEETTGRPARTAKGPQDGLATPTLSVSPKKGASGAPSPDGRGRFRNVADDGARIPMDFRRSSMVNLEELAEEDDDSEAISLQDFLNLTSIRFMELTTTKRRHTVVPSANKIGSDEDGKADMSFERCVVAGACTVPMLELYQHSCRELKKYISEGRDIVREIEMETLEDNPPLFREYMSATPEFKLLMDNQFKNVKTHARLLSKAMWYEWRMKLQEGLKEGLDRTVEGFESDQQILRKQRELIDSVLPGLVSQLESLQREHQVLDEAVRELADCDPEELEAARERLMAANDDVAVKRREIAALREDLRESEVDVEELASRKAQCLADIKEAEHVREECRGWSSGEIMALKARVAAIEEEHGWAVTGCSGTTVSMTYRREIELVFDPTCFASGPTRQGGALPNSNSTTPIDLWYIADKRERDPQPLTPELDFFLQCLRDQLRGLDQTRTPQSLILGLVSRGWAQANSVANHVRSLNLTFPTAVSRTSDDSIAVRATVFLAALKSKVDVVVDLYRRAGAASDGGGLDVAVAPRAVVVYGERFNTEKMADFLSGRLGGQVAVLGGGEGRAESWGDVVVELHGKLLSGAKQ
ncbi:hypothetical protein RB594_000481 [Gaeumannomyces avenae]